MNYKKKSYEDCQQTLKKKKKKNQPTIKLNVIAAKGTTCSEFALFQPTFGLISDFDWNS